MQTGWDGQMGPSDHRGPDTLATLARRYGGSGESTLMTRSLVVTGASSGIGRALAAGLAADGWRVVAVGRRRDILGDLAAAIGGVVPVVGDLTEPETLAAARETAEAEGTLAAWINNAAITHVMPLHEVDVAAVRDMVATDLTAVILGCQQAVQSFLASGTAGSIVNISSIHSSRGFPGWTTYDACKGGIEALTRSVCVEYASRGIRCNAVAPGGILSGMSLTLLDQAADRDAELARADLLSPSGRPGTEDEVLGAVRFLLSDGASYINGHVLSVDGGAGAWVGPSVMTRQPE